MTVVPQRLVFGRFELRPAERLLLVDGLPAALGARAFDVLVALAARRDHVVDKDELFDAVWPGQVVVESNITAQVSLLRKLLGKDVISTIAGRGYRFTAHATEPLLDRQPALRLGNLPAAGPELFGREADLQAALVALAQRRLVSVCGAGGIGKTSLAQQVAVSFSPRPAQGAWVVDLCATHEGARVTSLLAQTLGLSLPGQAPALEEISRALRDSDLLLVLDNCEHLLAAVAPLAYALLREAPRVRLLVTSQEPLHLAGEQVYRLGPLGVPAPDDLGHADDYGAVQLFVERVRAQQVDFLPSGGEWAAVADICRQLDGNALAIELAAARVPLLGLEGVRTRLSERLRTLAGGPRSLGQRHQTLHAALDWSFQLLPPQTQRVLCCLGVFSGGFCLDAALPVVAEDPSEDEAWLLGQFASLLDRSLLVVIQQGTQPRYRLLETMREFALARLTDQQVISSVRLRHALAMRAVLRRAVRERDSDRQLAELGNIRGALDHACAEADKTPDLGTVALQLATDCTVVLATSGLVPEVLQNLLRVETFVNDSTDPALAAQYWQWVGRVGKDGRLPAKRCIEVLQRAEGMFVALARPRRVHACARQQAEAWLSLHDLDAAQVALDRAARLESARTPAADQMRRLRLAGLLADAKGHSDYALSLTQQALDIAERYGYRRYCYVLLADRAWVHLQVGQPDVAEQGLLELLARIPPGPHEGLPRAEALAALLAARIAAAKLDAAHEILHPTMAALSGCGLFFARGDIFAWLAAASGQAQVAAQVLGAVDEFHARVDVRRDRFGSRAHDEALRLVHTGFAPAEAAFWLSHGRHADEGVLAQMLARALAPVSGRQGDGVHDLR